MKEIKHSKLTPLLKLHLRETDTQEIVNEAFRIAEMHQYYKTENVNTPARFRTYLTKEEATDRNGNVLGILVQPGTVFEEFRFVSSLEVARKNLSIKK